MWVGDVPDLSGLNGNTPQLYAQPTMNWYHSFSLAVSSQGPSLPPVVTADSHPTPGPQGPQVYGGQPAPARHAVHDGDSAVPRLQQSHAGVGGEPRGLRPVSPKEHADRVWW